MISKSSFDSVSRHWRSRIDGSHDFMVVRNDSVFRAGFAVSPVFETDFRKAAELKKDYLERYEGHALEEVFDGRTLSTPEGECFEITTSTGIRVENPDPENIRKRVLHDLTLIRGIGPVTAGMLRRKGIRTIEDLIPHRRFRWSAKECAAVIMEGSEGELVSLITSRHSPSHPLSVMAAGLYGAGSCLFVDIETMGFFSRPVILFGVAAVEDGEVMVRQFLVRSMDEEFPALDMTMRYMQERPVVVTYNGKSFDIPYLESRTAFYGGAFERPHHHVDLLHVSRRNAGQQVQDCRLTTIEQHLLGTQRSHDLPGSMVPEFYESYLQSGNPGPLVPIVEHNRKDVTSLAQLLLHFFEGPL